MSKLSKKLFYVYVLQSQKWFGHMKIIENRRNYDPIVFSVHVVLTDNHSVLLLINVQCVVNYY